MTNPPDCCTPAEPCPPDATRSFYVTVVGAMDYTDPIDVVLRSGVRLTGWAVGVSGRATFNLCERPNAHLPGWDVAFSEVAAIRTLGFTEPDERSTA